MGSWGVGAFENDRACDEYEWLDGVNEDGLNAFIHAALFSQFEEVKTLAIAIVGLCVSGEDKRIFDRYSNEKITAQIKSFKIHEALIKEAEYVAEVLFHQGNKLGWIHFDERLKMLDLLYSKLEKKGE